MSDSLQTKIRFTIAWILVALFSVNEMSFETLDFVFNLTSYMHATKEHVLMKSHVFISYALKIQKPVLIYFTTELVLN